MKYKIFQPYYQQEQLESLNSDFFTPFDNLANEKPEQREYHLFKLAIERGDTADLDAWGFFSPHWEKKTRTAPKDFVRWMESTPDHDVYLINHARIQEAVSLNVWEQGEWFHPKITDATEKVLHKMGYDVELKKILMSHGTYCFSSFFVGSKKFWTDYLEFIDKFIDTLDGVDESKQIIYETNAGYNRDRSLNYFVFVVERLFPTFLHLTAGKYKVANYPYMYDEYKQHLHEILYLVISLSYMKRAAINLDDTELFKQWNSARQHFLQVCPNAIHLDS